MQLEVGKMYSNRIGQTIGPIEQHDSTEFPFTWSKGHTYQPNGKYTANTTLEHPSDLVKELTKKDFVDDPQATEPTTEQIDNMFDTIKQFCSPLDADTAQKQIEIISQGGTKFSTGAVRSADKAGVMYQLISPIGMRRMAETMKEGFDKYGAYNWEAGMPIGDILNHAIAHIYTYLENPSPEKRGEDDLAHAAWNLFAAMHMEEKHPELDHGLRK